MKCNLKQLVATSVMMSALALMGTMAKADLTVTVDSAIDLGFMNVFEIDRTGPVPVAGDFVFGSNWGFADLTANFEGDGSLTLGPNTIGDPDPFWYVGGGGPGALGNKWMDANSFAQFSDGSLSGMNVTFTGEVLSHTLTPNHSVFAFIRDFAPDFSSFNETILELTPSSGTFSIELDTLADVGRNVQYGFAFRGENVWVTDVGPFGSVNIGAASVIPEPGSIGLLGLVAMTCLVRRRRSC